MTTVQDLYVSGLKNAHAMESQAHELLERQAGRLDEFPELRECVTRHLQETKTQLERLERCLSSMDSSPSSLKDSALSFGANLTAMANAMAGDEILKNTFANSAFEHYEIAAYKSLLALAKQAGVEHRELEQSLQEEERMADWIDEHVEPITMEYLHFEERRAA
jgi:ferritin-like metal-binding protein YciE